MKNLNSRIERLKQMIALEERRLALQGELDSILQEISSLKDRLLDDTASFAAPVSRQPEAPRRKAGKRQGRGLLKDKVMAALEAAGSAGVYVKELATTFGTKPVNVHSWFHSALKRNAPIEKITGGHYRLDGKAAGPKAPATAAPKAAKAPKGKKRRGAKRGQLTSDILAGLTEAGSGGISVADLAAKLGANYKNIYIWFATTGKKNPAVKKLGPAKYKLAA